VLAYLVGVALVGAILSEPTGPFLKVEDPPHYADDSGLITLMPQLHQLDGPPDGGNRRTPHATVESCFATHFPDQSIVQSLVRARRTAKRTACQEAGASGPVIEERGQTSDSVAQSRQVVFDSGYHRPRLLYLDGTEPPQSI
jgi:hypothetical protein